MPGEGIFLQVGSELVVLEERAYDSEALLQEALARFPEVMAGSTTTGSGSTRLLLVRREMGVPSAEGAGATWSLDHLFVDAEGIPVLVEVKRSSDTRVRREVVGQMLDYAANAVRYWPIETLREALERTAAEQGRTGEQLLAELRPELEVEEFWKAVETNLVAGRVRMLFVADALPPELVRIIEFLNEQLRPAEVLGIELRQYVGEDHRAYVPGVVGRSTTAVATKTGGAGRQWDRNSFLEAAAGRCPPAELALIRQLLEDVDRRGSRLSWGKGVTPGVAGWYPLGGEPTGVWVLNANNENPATKAYLNFYLPEAARRLGPERVERAAAILSRLPGMETKMAEARAIGWNKYPSLYLRDVASDEHLVEVLLAGISDLLAPS
jgi:hypothetical protein